MHQGIIYLGSMLNDAMWGQDVFYIMHQGMIYVQELCLMKQCGVRTYSILCIKE